MSLNGIIISTQTPSNEETFPRPGGTSWGLSKATGLSAIHMHRDGLARSNEVKLLNHVDDNGIVFITGHGSTKGNVFGGNYVSLAQEINTMWKWSLDTYVNLICDNSALGLKAKRGESPKLTLVLWVCYGGQGSKNSTAAKMIELFKDKGIDVTIIANNAATTRFPGFDNISDYNEERGLPFLAPHYANIRVFKSFDGEVKEYTVSEQIYFGKSGITGLPENFELQERVRSIELDKRFVKLSTIEQFDLESYLRTKPGFFLLTESPFNKTESDSNQYYYFDILYLDESGKSKKASHRIDQHGIVTKKIEQDGIVDWLSCYEESSNQLTKATESYQSLYIPEKVKQLLSRQDFIIGKSTRQSAEERLNKGEPVIIRSSSLNKFDEKSMPFYFAVSWNDPITKKIRHDLFAINSNNEIVKSNGSIILGKSSHQNVTQLLAFYQRRATEQENSIVIDNVGKEELIEDTKKAQEIELLIRKIKKVLLQFKEKINQEPNEFYKVEAEKIYHLMVRELAIYEEKKDQAEPLEIIRTIESNIKQALPKFDCSPTWVDLFKNILISIANFFLSKDKQYTFFRPCGYQALQDLNKELKEYKFAESILPTMVKAL